MSSVEWFRKVDCKMCWQKRDKHPIRLGMIITADLSLIDYMAGSEKVVNISLLEALLLARASCAVKSCQVKRYFFLENFPWVAKKGQVKY